MNAIEPTKDFQTRIFERIRDQMGDLMTDEDLKKITAAALERALFAKVTERNGYHTTEHESLLVKLIGAELKTRVEEAVKAWVAANEAKITEAVDATLAKGITKIVSDHFDMKFQWPLSQLADNLRQRGVL